MNIDEALELFEKNGVASSKQMIRRWIRQEKIKAKLHSKRQGYEIDAESLISFVEEKKKNIKNPARYQEGFQDGYAAAMEEISERFKRMLFLGMYEKQFPISRSEFRNICADKISTRNLKSFLEFVDKNCFGRGVSKPRQQIYCNQIADFFYFEKAGITIDQRKYDRDQDISIEDTAYDMLIKKLLKDFRDK
ncbi:hypothetical protein P7D43_18775 [Enterococcus avium]|uniref:HTH merR-type domain-containing protein n=1 Tax=Enterococcus avium TaxID=33945 RepID=A0AAW8RWN2_ENTAV|nr:MULTISPECIES: hypothetical protein [Enterococcus]MDT2404414.1 hypothetical protein [Enterococcus avium]MDT2434282.1 hypothetical protein [Enterococcus avium]MDT2466095.1 hypothetical protein [Enterococcus avium]MDT2485575.1 hypothetical protein [Enterococcus avium]MDT2505521.1 hypothetical protein [Enterococcus avium]